MKYVQRELRTRILNKRRRQALTSNWLFINTKAKCIWKYNSKERKLKTIKAQQDFFQVMVTHALPKRTVLLSINRSMLRLSEPSFAIWAASIISQVCVSWCLPMIVVSSKRGVQPQDWQWMDKQPSLALCTLVLCWQRRSFRHLPVWHLHESGIR